MMLALKSGPQIASKVGNPAGLLCRRIWYSVGKSGVLGIMEYRQGRPLTLTNTSLLCIEFSVMSDPSEIRPMNLQPTVSLTLNIETSHSDDWESVPKKSVILSGPRDGGPYKREDFLEGLEFILQGKIKDSVVTFGPLAKNSEWCLVLNDQATKDKLLLASYVAVKEVNFRIRSADSSQFIVRVRWAIPFIPSSAMTKTLDELCKHTHVLSIADEKLSQKGFEGVATGVRSMVKAIQETFLPC